MLNTIFKKVLAADGNTTITLPDAGAKAGQIGALDSLSNLVTFVINLVFGIGLALALLFVIIGGIKYITSQGDEGKATEARNTITNAVIGAVVIIAFRVLINLALNIVGAENIDTYFK